MKISICIPQYNRIEYLLKNLSQIAKQSYDNIEIIISDDNSSDDTENKILKIVPTYRYPIIYSKNNPNVGYDRNLRKSMELASGEYCFILGNDDTLYKPDDIEYLVAFLVKNKYPEIGFCNYVEEKNLSTIFQRASKTGVIGTGENIGLKYYRSFSFVAGIIWKREAFLKINTNKFDLSVYSQLYLALRIILTGGNLFTIEKPLVIKDIIIEGKIVNSYRDKISRKWKDFKITDGGLPRVIMVSSAAFKDSIQKENDRAAFKIIKDIYFITFPYWIIDYKKNTAFVAAIGLIFGMFPLKNKIITALPFHKLLFIFLSYFIISIGAILFPSILFHKLKPIIYKWIK